MQNQELAPRYEYLDLIRLLAALFVLSLHFGFAMQHYRYGRVASLSYAEPLGRVAKYGLLGVDIFFVISGAVISISALSKLPNQFAISRFARLFPSFILIIPVAILVTRFLSADDKTPYAGKAGLRDLIFSLNLSNWIFGTPQVAEGATWTLWVEVRFYFLIFLVLSILRMMNKTLKVQTLITLAYSWYFLSAIAQVSGFSLFQNLFISDYSSYFLVGISIAVIALNPKFKNSVYPLLFFSGISSVHELQIRLAGLSDLVGVCIFFIAVGAIRYSFSHRPKNLILKKILVIGGALSYPLYLVHDRVGGSLLAYFDLKFHNHMINMLYTVAILFIPLILWVTKLEPKFRKSLIKKLASEWS